MSYFVLVRHGESRWNKSNKFTGWVDVPLSVKGVREAEQCALHCKKYDFDIAFTSTLERAHSTLLVILTQQNRTGIIQHEGKHSDYYRWTCDSNTCLPDDIPVFESETLNERYYGKLQGMNKKEAEQKYGKEKVFAWRRSYIRRPPGGESLKGAFTRVHPYFDANILPHIKKGENVLLVGHGNTLRGIMKHIEHISDDDIAFVDLPEGKPIVYTYQRGKLKRQNGDQHLGRPLR